MIAWQFMFGAGRLNRLVKCKYVDGVLTVSIYKDLRLCIAGCFEGMEGCTLLEDGLWTVGIEDGLVLFFDGLEMR